MVITYIDRACSSPLSRRVVARLSQNARFIFDTTVPLCRSVFKREPGFFVGVDSGERCRNRADRSGPVLLSFHCWCLGVEYSRVLWLLLFSIAVVFPVAFYHHSWSLWLSVRIIW